MTTTSTLLAPHHAGHTYLVRFDPQHPMAAHLVLDRWYRTGVLPATAFGVAVCQVCQLANEAREA